MHILAQKFLEYEEHKHLLEDYQSFPTEEKKQHIQSLFNQFHLELQLYEHLSENIPLIAENILKDSNYNNYILFSLHLGGIFYGLAGF